MSKSKTAVTAGGLELRNPILVASGTCGYGHEIRPLLDLSRIGGVVTKTIFKDPRPGNPPPRIFKTPSGLLNSIGLEGVGIDRLVSEKLPHLESQETRVVVSIGGHGPGDFADLAARLDDVSRVDAMELNISCPNVKEGGLDMSTHPHLAYDVVKAVRGATRKPIWAKLTPNVTRISDVGRACLDAGADGLSAVNTLLGMVINVETGRPAVSRGVGGLSGPAIRPVAVAKCWELVRALECDVIGIGGITGTRDMLEFLLAGCKAVQVGTAVYVDPSLPERMAGELDEWMAEKEISGLDAVIGSVRMNWDLTPDPRETDRGGTREEH